MLDWTAVLDTLVGLEAVGLYEIELCKHFYEREEIKCVSIFCRTQVPYLVGVHPYDPIIVITIITGL